MSLYIDLKQHLFKYSNDVNNKKTFVYPFDNFFVEFRT
jgi:hypothetical protein